MEKIFFRPNAPLSSLFNDLPNETIIIDEDTISETITDYQGNVLVEKERFGGRPELQVLETLIAAFDAVSEPIDVNLYEVSFEGLCNWFCHVLKSRGWVPVKAYWDNGSKTVNGQELFFEMEIDDAENS